MRKIPVHTGYPSVAHRDMARKFVDDLKSVIERNGPILDLAVGENYAQNIILSGLALAGVRVSREAGGERGTFAAMVLAFEEHEEPTEH